jgi:hypothetical protein
MDSENIHSEALGHEEDEEQGQTVQQARAHVHEWQPIDQSYNLVVRTVLWIIVGAVFVGFMLWWVMT